MTRILAIADETTPALTVSAIRDIDADVVVSCGDLPFDYVDYVASAANRPLVFVPGNHDPAIANERPISLNGEQDAWNDCAGPVGGCNLDGQIVEEGGLTFAGLGGSIRYRPGANQYTEREMRRRAMRLEARARWRRMRRKRPVDVLVTHSPPRDLGDMPDPAHRGFESFHRLVEQLAPRVMIHGHIHPHGFEKPDRALGDVTIMNVVPYRVIEVAS
jgi:predicted phosphodiesterase